MRKCYVVLVALSAACQFDTTGSGVPADVDTLGGASTSGESGSEGTTAPPSDTSEVPPDPESSTSTTSAGSEGSTDPPDPSDTSGDASTTDASSTTGLAEEFCGDAIRADDEDCDDGNLDELDGCTSACQVGPTGIAHGQRSELKDRFGGYANGTFNTVTDCDDGERLVGVRGTFSYYAQYFVLARLQGICAPLELRNEVPTTIELGPTTTLAELGTYSSSEDTAFELMCPADAVLSGLEGFGGLYTDRVGLECRTVGLDDNATAFDLGPRQRGPSYGAPDGGSFQEVSCPGSSLAAGFRVRGDAYAAGIFLRCEDTELTFVR